MEVKTEMNIEKAVKHLTWRLSQPKMIPNENDKEAYNFILKTLNQNYEQALIQDVLFGKLLIEKLLFLTSLEKNTMSAAIEKTREILQTPLFEMAEHFVKEVPMIRLSQAIEKEFITIDLTNDKFKDCKNIYEAQNLLMSRNQKKFTEEFTKPYTSEEFKNFIKRLVFELKNEYQNKP